MFMLMNLAIFPLHTLVLNKIFIKVLISKMYTEVSSLKFQNNIFKPCFLLFKYEIHVITEQLCPTKYFEESLLKRCIFIAIKHESLTQNCTQITDNYFSKHFKITWHMF
jgi:hypothetical protein